METGEQGEAAKLEDAGGRKRLLGWRRLEWRARLLGQRRPLPEGSSYVTSGVFSAGCNHRRWVKIKFNGIYNA